MLITLKNIKKTLGGTVLFEDLNFELKENEKIGLVGRNGSGKSTLFRLITKDESIDEGDLFIQKGLTIGYLRQIPSEWEGTGRSYLKSSFEKLLKMIREMNELEVAMQDSAKMESALYKYGQLQDRFAQGGGYEMEANIEKVSAGLGITELLDQSFEQLSGGEKTKLGLARILLEEPDVLLLDEPTNHLDLNAIEWLEQYLCNYSGAVCIISHDRVFLDHTISSIADLEEGEITKYSGGYSSFEQQKEEKLLAEFQEYKEQQKKIKKMKEAIRRLRQWASEASPPNPKLFKKAKSMERALEKMEKKEKPLIDPKKMNLSLEADGRSGTDVFVAENICKAFGGRQILNGINLHLRYKERVALVGGNGSGKSTLMGILLGHSYPDSGQIKGGRSMKIGYLPQDPLHGADPDMRMIDYFREHVIVTEGQARQILAHFMFYGYSVFHKIRQLSGGEQMRLKLAVFMNQGINILLLDEPTNHLDIESQEVLEEALNKFTGTVLGISHDRYFLNRCFTDTAYLIDGQLHRFHGTYNETQHKWKNIQHQVEQKGVSEKKSSKSKAENSEHPRDYEHLILRAEQKLERLKNEMEKADQQERRMDLESEKVRLEKELDELYGKWIST
ncbi:ribosomal protection-like ABC-F family protein [Thalassobacillus pellis]|uniref:ribosomal protection-like ABC-F family protein n=1 Tax=Thalassobacillus pellis TaxID=748008 RepID=UPI001961DF91|nr:ABC-F family ATP-binding cassette domain-containing protein [Thalassobacillus pellis]MBM7554379.1 ATPase subunit of ABC transporter with duplicated ATPase domains [Thalassobacillus pellis]